MWLFFFSSLFYQLTAQLNPNCPSSICDNDNKNENDSNETTLIHVKAEGENDTLHYIWDLSRQPSVLVALCDRNTNITIKWNKTLKNADAIEFTTKPMYTMSFVLTKVSNMNSDNMCYNVSKL